MVRNITFGEEQPSIGVMVSEFANPNIIRVLKAGGFSFAIIDNEHGYFDFSQLAAMIGIGNAYCVVMSAGAAGVPGGGIMMCTICLNTMGMPDATMVAIIAGIYILIDFVGTMINVTSDTVGMVTIAAITNELDRDTFNVKNED